MDRNYKKFCLFCTILVPCFIILLIASVKADSVASPEVVEEYVTPTPRPTLQPIISPLPDLPSDFYSAVDLFEDSASNSLGWAGSIVNGISNHPIYLIICCIPIVILIIALLRRILK